MHPFGWLMQLPSHHFKSALIQATPQLSCIVHKQRPQIHVWLRVLSVVCLFFHASTSEPLVPGLGLIFRKTFEDSQYMKSSGRGEAACEMSLWSSSLPRKKSVGFRFIFAHARSCLVRRSVQVRAADFQTSLQTEAQRRHELSSVPQFHTFSTS